MKPFVFFLVLQRALKSATINVGYSVVAPIIVVSICFTSELPNYDRIIGALLEHGLAELSKHCYLTPGNLLWN